MFLIHLSHSVVSHGPEQWVIRDPLHLSVIIQRNIRIFNTCEPVFIELTQSQIRLRLALSRREVVVFLSQEQIQIELEILHIHHLLHVSCQISYVAR